MNVSFHGKANSYDKLIENQIKDAVTQKHQNK